MFAFQMILKKNEDMLQNIYSPLEYERVYLPLCKVADTPFHMQGHELYMKWKLSTSL